MQTLSVVIVCKNEADNLGRTLSSLQGLTDDIVVYDNGSEDATLSIAAQFPVRIEEGAWEGFGKTKRSASRLAKYDWILSLDADEAIDEQLKQSLLSLTPGNGDTVYELAFKNYFGEKHLRYGEWGGDKHIRLYNRTRVNWDEAPVHEGLIIPPGTSVKKLEGFVLHRTMTDVAEYASKMVKYALLNAEKYHRQGKKAGWLKARFSPAFTFFNYYLLRLGFLDGKAGYTCAKMTAWYTFLKYVRLRELNDKKN